MRIISANYVLPISSDPIRNGAVAIDGSAIAAVGTRDDLCATFPGVKHEDFGEAAVIPGFVNCHSHLEITAMRGALDSVENDFRSWLLRLNDLRRRMNDDDIATAALAGATEGARSGVTCFGDIGRFGWAGLNALKTVGLRGVVFQETEFSPDEKTAGDDFSVLREKFLSLVEPRTDLVDVGISPHSPYTVSRRLFEMIGRHAADEGIKITIHAAESAEEDSLMLEGEGFFSGLYEKFGYEWQSPHCSSIEFLSQTGILETKPLLAHCVKVTGSDIAIIAEAGAKIAHCPKSNAKFGHGVAPFQRFLDAGVPVGLGSDSVASNNLCDLLEESRFAALAARTLVDHQRFISAAEALEAATLGGARALGLEATIGTLESGKQADIAVVSLAGISQKPVTDVHASLLFSSSAQQVRATIVGGCEIYRDGILKTFDEARLQEQLRQTARLFSEGV